MVGLGMIPELKRPTWRSRLTQKGKYRLTVKTKQYLREVNKWLCSVKKAFSAFNLGPFVMVLPDDGHRRCPIQSHWWPYSDYADDCSGLCVIVKYNDVVPLRTLGIFVKLRLPGRSGPENIFIPSLGTSNTSEKISIVADLSLMTLIE